MRRRLRTVERRHAEPLRAHTASPALAIVIAVACACASEHEPDVAAAPPSSEGRCLALSMYWEAKAEGERGMRAVGHVVMNRVADDRFPDTPCAVVHQGGERPPCQFSWYCDGKSDRPTELRAWRTAERLAEELLAERLRDTTRGALFFHAKRIETPWRTKRRRTVTIGDHVFYR